jgi:hypothetical protein
MEVSDDAFETLYELECINVEAENEIFFSKEGILMAQRPGIELVRCPRNYPNRNVSDDSVNFVATKAFGGCTNVSYIYFENLISIGDFAFQNCQIQSFTIGSHVEFIGTCAFYSQSLESIYLNEENSYFKQENGVLFTKDMTEMIYYNRNNSNDFYEIPSSVYKIRERAILYPETTMAFIIGTNVTHLEYCAFETHDYTQYFIEHITTPANWIDVWTNAMWYSPNYIYWNGQWHMENGVPTPNI